MSPTTPQQAAAPEPARRISLGKAAGLGALTSISTVVVALIRSKAAAIYLGPEGVGIAAELQQVATLALVPLAALTGPALLTALAKEQSDDGPRRAIGAALGWLMVLGAVLSAVAVGGLFYTLSGAWAEGLRPLLALSCFALVLTSAASIGVGSLTFDQSLKTTAKLQIGTGLFAAVTIAAATAWAGLTGQFVGAALANAVTVLVVFRAARRSSRWPTSLLPALDSGYLRNALRIGAASLAGGAAMQGALFAIRSRFDQYGGPEANGQFQAAWAAGSVYLGLVLSGMGTFVFPRYATAKDTAELQAQMDEAARFVMQVAPPVVFLAIGFADIAIRVMYSHRFDDALGILKWQFVGDVAKCLSWVYAGPLLYRGKVRAFLVTESLAAAMFAIGSWVLIPRFGLAASGIAYLTTYALYLVVTSAVARPVLGVAARRGHIAIAAIGTTIALGLATGGPGPTWRIVAILAAAAWSVRSGLARPVLTRVHRHIKERHTTGNN